MNYETALDSISHYQKFPCMKPWIGKEYDSPQHKKLLIIGESHYLSKGMTVHHDAPKWYEGTQESVGSDLSWIHTRGTFPDQMKPKNMAPRICEALRESIPSNIDQLRSPEALIEQIAFYNFFQRPADTEGRGMKPKSLDVEVANEIFSRVVSALSPDLIVFVSALSYDRSYSTHKSLEISGACICRAVHPTTLNGKWWNSSFRASRRGNLPGKKWTRKFLLDNQWWVSPAGVSIEKPEIQARGGMILSPGQAILSPRKKLRVEAKNGISNLGYWTEKDDVATWRFQNDKAQKVSIKARIGAPKDSQGCVIEFVCGDQVLPLLINETGGWSACRDVPVPGEFKLPVGDVAISVRVNFRAPKSFAPCNLFSVELIPVNDGAIPS